MGSVSAEVCQGRLDSRVSRSRDGRGYAEKSSSGATKSERRKLKFCAYFGENKDDRGTLN